MPELVAPAQLCGAAAFCRHRQLPGAEPIADWIEATIHQIEILWVCLSVL